MWGREKEADDPYLHDRYEICTTIRPPTHGILQDTALKVLMRTRMRDASNAPREQRGREFSLAYIRFLSRNRPSK